ncbi:MAG: SDR family oxidoreductase [Rhizobiales bacterium]|nr:SDR family oxidoreductase [Hyphomicrobiales bacterium]
MKAALITGAAKRIGRAMALALARDGWNVAVHCHESIGEAAELVDEMRRLGRKAVAIEGDLAGRETPKKLIKKAKGTLGPLTLLINNASRFEPDELATVTMRDWDKDQAINLRAPVFLSQAFAAQLPVKQQGNIINLIDQRVWKLNPQYFSYTASKGGLWVVTQTMAQALAPRIRVNAIAPGPALPNVRMRDREFEKLQRLTLLKRGTSPEEIAAAVRFILASPAMTGQMIALDGGQHLAWQTPDVVKVRE